MNAIASVIRHLRGKPAASVTKPVNRSPQGRATRLPFIRPESPASRNTMKTFRSPLSIDRPLKSAEVDAIDIVFTAPEVIAAAGRLNLRRTSLLEVAGLRGAVAEAIAHVVGDGDSFDIDEVSPALIASVLDGFASCVDDEIAAALEDHVRHNARRRARLDRLAPLRNAVAARLADLTAEQRMLIGRVDAARRAATMGAETANTRFTHLIAAGLTREQIAALGPDVDDPEAKIAAYLARVAEIRELLPPLQAFLDDSRGDVAVLAGFSEFDDLVKARLAAAQEPA